MKPRSQLTAADLESLYEGIDRRLGAMILPTQPEVAARVLDLISDHSAGLREYSAVIKTDSALTGRLLRMANSAYFAQRKPVTSLDRVCVLLGIGRLKAVALGFYLSKAAVSDPGSLLSRRVWGESVFRACLSAELMKTVCPGLTAEAFVVGLMLDSGIPLLRSLLGPPVDGILVQNLAPAHQFHAEFEGLEFTHVDVAAAMSRRWRLPELLSRPIEWHHAHPGDLARTEPLHALHRVAYYVGAIRLDSSGLPSEMPPLPDMGDRIFGLDTGKLGDVSRGAAREYQALREMFGHMAAPLGDPDLLAERVHHELVSVLDETLTSEIREPARATAERFPVGEYEVEVEMDEQGRAVAFVRDGCGERILSHVFTPGQQPVETVLAALGIENAPADHARVLDTFLRSIAA